MDSKGFTLLELMITLSIIGISASVGYETLSKSSIEAIEKQQAEKVRGALMKARSMALTTLDCVSVQIRPNAISITRYRVCGPTLDQVVSTEEIKVGEEVVLSKQSEDDQITFTASGAIRNKGKQTLVAKGAKKGRLFRYTVMPATGVVRTEI